MKLRHGATRSDISSKSQHQSLNFFRATSIALNRPRSESAATGCLVRERMPALLPSPRPAHSPSDPRLWYPPPGRSIEGWGPWASEDRRVYYLYYPDKDPSTQSTIRFLDLRTKETRTIYWLTKHPVLWDGGMALSPDGKWLVFAELDHAGSNIQLLEPFR